MSVENMIHYIKGYPHLQAWGLFALMVFLLLIYRKIRTEQWRRILKGSIEYHKFYLVSISNDSSADTQSRELAHSLLWGITRQLPLDIKEGGLRALLNTFAARKTSLNTCGTVFYQFAMNYKSMDITLFKLNNTLTSTLYRIFILESAFSIPGLFFYDISLFFNAIIKPESGTGRFYLEMKRETEGINLL